jgi:putative transposase
LRKKQFSDEQMALALRSAGAGTTDGEVCRKIGIAEAMILPLEKDLRRV